MRGSWYGRMTPSGQRRLGRIVASALVAALLLGGAVKALGPAGRAGRIATRSAAARGGLDAWRAVTAMSMSGKLEAGVGRDPVRLATVYQNQILGKASGHGAHGLRAAPAERPVQLPFTLELKRPRRSRLEIQFRGQTAVQVFDGQEGWKLRPFLGRREVEAFEPEELQLAGQQAELDGPLLDFSAKGTKLELVATEKVEGRDAYKIKVTTKSGDVRHVWVDARSYLEVKIEGSRRMDGKLRPVWTHLRDYRPVDGLMIPHVLETSVEGVAGSEKILIERVTINPALADARFARPEVPSGDGRPASPEGEDPGKAGGGGAGPQAKPGAAAGPLKRAQRSTAAYTIPEVTLVREDGESVSLPRELDDGRAVVVNFVFTTCATICPVMSQVFSQLQDRLGADRDKVHMVSVSIDPEQDRPTRLAEYAKKFHAGPQWRLYTGTVAASVAVQRAFDAYRGEKMNHTPVTYLRSAPGSPWVRIDGFASADELANEVHVLLASR